jgi:hypothetical protein
MTDVSADLVDIVRDFTTVHRAMKQLFASYRSDELKFEDLRELIGDDEQSVLYRLKERCHALFRPRDAASPLSTRGEVLFDLAVGSLFHEAMKFRENFYQQEIYGPQVRALGADSTEEADVLFREFEKILANGSERLSEGLQETEILIEQTADQLRVLLSEHANNGFVARFLLENREQVDEVFGFSLESLFCEIEGSARAGLELAGRSYLDSGFYREAELTFAAAIDSDGDAVDLERLSQYARGMAAYLAGNFAECVSRLAKWFDGGAVNEENLLDIARAAVSKIDQLAEGDDSERVIAEAVALVERFGPTTPVEPVGTS